MPDLGDYTTYLIAGAVVLVVLIIILVVLRSFQGGMGGRRGMRLGISEYYEIDKTRRLILVRRDNVEHLVLIGGGQDVVIEPGISGRGSEPGMRSPARTSCSRASSSRRRSANILSPRESRRSRSAPIRCARSDRARHPDRRYSVTTDHRICGR